MRRRIVGISVVALLARWPLAAALAPITIQVIEEDTRLPIAGARVLLFHNDSSKPQTCVTDGSGACKFSVAEAGNYFPRVSAEGYVLRSFLAGQRFFFFEVEDSPSAAPNHTQTFTFYKPGSILGQLEDTRTKQPLSGLKVTAVEAAYTEGKRRFELNRASVTSDEMGAFRLDDLAPGVYFLQIEDNLREEVLSKRLPDYGQDHQPAEAYGRQYWPEIPHDAGAGVTIRSGGVLDVGKVGLSKKALGRIRGRLLSAGCSERDPLKLSIKPLLPELSLLARTIDLECGSPFTIQNLPATKYQVEVWMDGRSLRNGYFSLAEVAVQPGTDVELDLSMQGPLLVTGRVICECQNSENSRYKGEIRLSSVRSSHFPPADLSPVGADGTFQVFAIPERESQIALSPLPKMYLKRVSYNGVDVDAAFALNPYAISHSLEVIISDKPAELTGAVSLNGSPLVAGHVVLAPWPLRLIDGFPEYREVETDVAGKFAFRNVPAGKYRIVSVGERSWEMLDMPGALASWIAAGQALALEENESKNVTTEHRIP